jgi:hypothetical protein
MHSRCCRRAGTPNHAAVHSVIIGGAAGLSAVAAATLSSHSDRLLHRDLTQAPCAASRLGRCENE